MEAAIVKGAGSGMGAIYIFFFIGMLISIWMASGTIPTIMFYGFDWISGEYFYAITFLVCSLIGLCIGSSLTTSATIGVALIGMAAAMDLSLAITAGAIISVHFLEIKCLHCPTLPTLHRERLEHHYLNILIICFGLRFQVFSYRLSSFTSFHRMSKLLALRKSKP